LIADGLNINVTLIFSLESYLAVTEAYIAGLEILAAKGNTDLQGKIAIANSKVVYARFKEIFSGARWDALAAKGARVQRPLWASTSTKNPNYPDTLYVDTLIGADTVNTVPPQTLDAILKRATVALTLEQGVDEARKQLEALAALGISLDQATQELQEEGVDSFAKSFESLMNSVDAKRVELLGKAV